MKLSKIGILCVALMTVPLASCGRQEPVDNTVTVFVLSGQSNMEGSTTYVSASGDQWLRNAFTRLNEENENLN